MNSVECGAADLSVGMVPDGFPGFGAGPAVFDSRGDFACGKETDADPVRIRMMTGPAMPQLYRASCSSVRLLKSGLEPPTV